MSLSGSASASTSVVSSSPSTGSAYMGSSATSAAGSSSWISSGIGSASSFNSSFGRRSVWTTRRSGRFGSGAARWRAAPFSRDFGSMSEISNAIESEVGAAGDVAAPAGFAGWPADRPGRGRSGSCRGLRRLGRRHGEVSAGGAAGRAGGAGARACGAAGRCAAGAAARRDARARAGTPGRARGGWRRRARVAAAAPWAAD